MSKIWNQWKHNILVATFIGVAALAGLTTTALHAQPKPKQETQKTNIVDIPGEGTVQEPQGGAYIEPKKLNPKLARVTLYRPAFGTTNGVAHVQINGHYHTSLQRGGYSEVCVQPSEFSLAANMVEADQADAGPQTSITFKPKAAQNLYVRVNDNGQHAVVITPVTDKIAKTELQNAHRQIHAATRVTDLAECVEPDNTPRVLKTEAIILPTDALFGFGKSDIKGISAEGREALDTLISTLQRKYGKLDKVQVNIVGHADPLGNPQANQRLSSARAQTIRAYLVKGGLDASKLSSEGRGDTQPVLTTCVKTVNPENIECNKPNRRVAVEVRVMDR